LLHSELGLSATEEFIGELGQEESVRGLAIAHAIAQTGVDTNGESFVAFANTSDVLPDPIYYLIAHFEWREGGRFGKRARYQIVDGKIKFTSLELLSDPKQRYLFGGHDGYLH
jgi:hypothetical protein